MRWLPVLCRCMQVSIVNSIPCRISKRLPQRLMHGAPASSWLHVSVTADSLMSRCQWISPHTSPEKILQLAVMMAGQCHGLSLCAAETEHVYWPAVPAQCIHKAPIRQLKQVEHTINERRLLQCITSSFCVRLFGAYQDAHSLMLLLEWVAGGAISFCRLPRLTARWVSDSVARSPYLLPCCKQRQQVSQHATAGVDHQSQTIASHSQHMVACPHLHCMLDPSQQSKAVCPSRISCCKSLLCSAHIFPHLRTRRRGVPSPGQGRRL